MTFKGPFQPKLFYDSVIPEIKQNMCFMKMLAYKHAYIHIQHRQLQKYKCHNKICGYIVEELCNELDNCNWMCETVLLQKLSYSSCIKCISCPL